MRTAKGLLILTGIFAALSAAMMLRSSVLSSGPKVRNTRAREEGASEIQNLRSELGALRAEVSGLRSLLGKAALLQKEPAKVETYPTPVEEPESAEPARDVTTVEKDDAEWKQHMVQVAAAFEREVPDRNFIAKNEVALSQAIRSNPTIDAVASKVDCRARTCRVEIRHAESDPVSIQLPLFLMSLNAFLPAMEADATHTQDGETKLALYLTAEGPSPSGPLRAEPN